MANRGVIFRPSAGWYLFNWLLRNSSEKKQRQLQQEAKDRQAAHNAYLIDQEHISKEKLIERSERLYRLKIRSENPELYKELLVEDSQRLHLENEHREEAKAAAQMRMRIELESWHKARRRNRWISLIAFSILAIVVVVVRTLGPRYASLAVIENTNVAPDPETTLAPETPPTPVDVDPASVNYLYKLIRDTDVITEPGATIVMRTVHANKFVHVIGTSDGATGKWLRIRMHDGTEGYIPEEVADYVSDWEGSAPSKTSP
jgi:hypothetical protein